MLCFFFFVVVVCLFVCVCVWIAPHAFIHLCVSTTILLQFVLCFFQVSVFRFRFARSPLFFFCAFFCGVFFFLHAGMLGPKPTNPSIACCFSPQPHDVAKQARLCSSLWVVCIGLRIKVFIRCTVPACHSLLLSDSTTHQLLFFFSPALPSFFVLWLCL